MLITARHVLFAPDEPNIDYTCTNTSTSPRRNVLLLSPHALDNLIKSIEEKILSHRYNIDLYERQIAQLQQEIAGGDKGDEDDPDDDPAKQLKSAQSRVQSRLEDAIDAIESLEKFHDQVKKDWSDPSQRVLGHVVGSPPITLGASTQGFTEDYAVVALDRSKIEKAFKGNVIDLGAV